MGCPREVLTERLPQLDKRLIINKSKGARILGAIEEETYLKFTRSPKFSKNLQ